MQVDVEDFDDIKSGYRISLIFGENPYFRSRALEKQYVFDDDGSCTILAEDPRWHEGQVSLLPPL